MVTISDTARNELLITHKDVFCSALLEMKGGQWTILGQFGESSVHVGIEEWEGFVEIVLAADQIRSEQVK
jgi:hypothetical protein